jgi:hypothetical protein
MIDIVSLHDGLDMGVFDTQTVRAENILSVQVLSLEYAQDLGIDLKFFLSEDFRFQNASFRSYLIEVLANRGINVASVINTVNNLFTQYTFNLTKEDSGSSLVTR